MTSLTPEEQILETIGTAMTDELNPLIEEINKERNEHWLQPVTTEMVKMTIGKMKRTIEDTLFTQEEYTLKIEFTFKDNEARTLGYRYSYALNRMLKNSTSIPPIADICITTEMIYHQNPKGDEREKSRAEFIILIRKDGF